MPEPWKMAGLLYAVSLLVLLAVYGWVVLA
jgi:hypothetical protein